MPDKPAQPGLVLHGSWQAIGFHLGPDLRHIVPEHDDVVLFAVHIPHMVAQERLGLETQALEQRDRGLLIDRHLHLQLLKSGSKSQREGFLRQCPADALTADVLRNHHPDFPDMRGP